MKHLVIGIVLGFAAGWFSHGWYVDSKELKEVKADDVQQAEEKTTAAAGEIKADDAERDGADQQKVIIRHVTKYLASPDRNVGVFDADSVRARQEAMDAANCIKGFDACAVSGGDSSGKR